MKNLRAQIPVIIAVGALSVGCIDTDAGFDTSFELPRKTMTTGTGTGGNNSLSVEALQNAKAMLREAMDHALVSPTGLPEPSAELRNSGLLDTEEGRELFTYAMRCALPIGDYINFEYIKNGSTVFETYEGEGILMTTKDWQAGGLTNSQKEDVFTCLLAHMNGEGVQVPIWLSGPNVTSTSARPANFDFEEAIWLARLGLDGAFTFHVWPSAGLIDACGPTFISDFGSRICDSANGNCGVNIRSDHEVCVGEDDSWTCDGQAAIQTTLQAYNLGLMYPECH